MPPTTLRARWVLTMAGPPLAGGYVAFNGGQIVAVERTSPGGTVDDLGDVVLAPGLVNPHTHLEFSDLAAPLGSAGTPLPAWIGEVIAYRNRGGRSTAAAIAAGLRESLAAGVTTLGEISAAAPADYAALHGDGAPTTVLFQEAIGFSGQRVASVLADVIARIEHATSAYGGDHRLGLSPHAPYSTNPRLVRQLGELAAARGLPVAIHLAESREELQLLADGDGPFPELLAARSMWDSTALADFARPLDYLKTLLASGAPRILAVHGNYFDAEEIALAGREAERLAVVYCPRTHARFGHDRYPLRQLFEAGAKVVLGTDSRASSPDLDLRAEARLAAEQFPDMAPQRLWRMITVEAAAALGIDDGRGRLAVGGPADLAAIALPQVASAVDPYAAALAADAKVVSVWRRGERCLGR